MQFQKHKVLYVITSYSIHYTKLYEYYAKTARNAVKKLRGTGEKEVASEMFPKVAAMLDKLAKKNIIHKNKASNLKSKLAKHINKL